MLMWEGGGGGEGGGEGGGGGEVWGVSVMGVWRGGLTGTFKLM